MRKGTFILMVFGSISLTACDISGSKFNMYTEDKNKKVESNNNATFVYEDLQQIFTAKLKYNLEQDKDNKENVINSRIGQWNDVLQKNIQINLQKYSIENLIEYLARLYNLKYEAEKCWLNCICIQGIESSCKYKLVDEVRRIKTSLEKNIEKAINCFKTKIPLLNDFAHMKSLIENQKNNINALIAYHKEKQKYKDEPEFDDYVCIYNNDWLRYESLSCCISTRLYDLNEEKLKSNMNDALLMEAKDLYTNLIAAASFKIEDCFNIMFARYIMNLDKSRSVKIYL
jgi:hypothetical protein